MTSDEKYMYRCLELAALGAAYVSPNPMVGAVLVHGDRIIGEGYHRVYGQPHAEVNCIDAVADADRHLLTDSRLFVSLEPCAHYGKTPPCADLIIRSGIPEVVIGCRDPFPQVDGKGIDKLLAAGVRVTVGILEEECIRLNKRFFTFHRKHRPFVILKWAATADGRIGYFGSGRLKITSDSTNRLVHRWRSEESAIMVGTNTAAADDPQLTNRLWFGKNPVRAVIDYDLRLLPTLKMFDRTTPTIVFNTLRHGDDNGIMYYQVTHDVSLPHQVMNALYQMKLTSILIEGGARLTQTFIDEDCWDEARVLTNEKLFVPAGVKAPVLTNARQTETIGLGSDTIRIFKHSK